jgi:hypothetical protein
VAAKKAPKAKAKSKKAEQPKPAVEEKLQAGSPMPPRPRVVGFGGGRFFGSMNG